MKSTCVFFLALYIFVTKKKKKKKLKPSFFSEPSIFLKKKHFNSYVSLHVNWLDTSWIPNVGVCDEQWVVVFFQPWKFLEW